MGRGANNLLYGSLSEASYPHLDSGYFLKQLIDNQEDSRPIDVQWLDNMLVLFDYLLECNQLSSSLANQFYDLFFKKIIPPINDHLQLAAALTYSPEDHGTDLQLMESFNDLFKKVIEHADLSNLEHADKGLSELFRHLIWLEQDSGGVALYDLWIDKVVKPGYLKHIYPVRGKAVIHFLAKYKKDGHSYSGTLCKKTRAIDWDNWSRATNPYRIHSGKYCQKCLALVSDKEQQSNLVLGQESYTDFLIRCSKPTGKKISEQFIKASKKEQLQEPVCQFVYQKLWNQIINEISTSKENSSSNPVFKRLSEINVFSEAATDEALAQFKPAELFIESEIDYKHYKAHIYLDK
jgi:hypothetical protein